MPIDGRGTVYSWVVTHRAFSEEFTDAVPYGIVAVDLVDGGRMTGRFVGDPKGLCAGLPLTAVVYVEGETALLGFEVSVDNPNSS